MIYLKFTCMYVFYFSINMLTFILAPFIVKYREEVNDWCDNGSIKRLEPRLKSFLMWFQTPDNSLYGDFGWRNIHCKEDWQTEKGMIGWLRRNRAHGLCWNVFNIIVDSPVTDYKGLPSVNRSKGNLGFFFCKYKKHFELKYAFKLPFVNFAMLFHFGWLIHPYITGPLPWYEKRAKFVAGIKIGNLDK